MHFYLHKIYTEDSLYNSTPLGRNMDWPPFVLSLVLGFIFLFLFSYFLLFSRPSLFPPGPPSLPLLGSYPFLSGNGPEKFFGPEVRRQHLLWKSSFRCVPLAPSLVSMLAPTPQLSSTTGPLQRVSLQKKSFVAVSSKKKGFGFSWSHYFSSNFTTNRARSLGGESLGIVMTDGESF